MQRHCPSWWRNSESLSGIRTRWSIHAGAALLMLLVGVASNVAASEAPTTDPASEQAQDDAADSETTPSLDERLDALLKEVVPEDEYRDSKRCLTRYDYRSVDILSEDYLLFVKGDRYWLNRLKNPCPALRYHNMVLSFNFQGTSSLCRGDQVYVTDRLNVDGGFDSAGRPLRSYGVCFLGEFESITVEQAALLKGVK